MSNIFQNLLTLPLIVSFLMSNEVNGGPSQSKKCNISNPFSDPCGDGGLCTPNQKNGFSCDCTKFRSSLYKFGEDSCTKSLRKFCSTSDRFKCSGHGECRSGYGGFGCLCDEGFHGQKCSSPSDKNNKYWQSVIILFRNKAAIGSIRDIFVLAKSEGSLSSFQIYDLLDIKLTSADSASTRKQNEEKFQLRQNEVIDNKDASSEKKRSISDLETSVQSGKEFCIEQFEDTEFCSVIPKDVIPIIKLQYPATKRDTVSNVYDDDGNFRGQPSELYLVLSNYDITEYKQKLYLFNTAQGNKSDCIPHLKIQDCSTSIPFFQRDTIIFRSYISPSIFCEEPVSMYNVQFQWNLYAGFQKLFNSEYPFDEHTPFLSSSEQNIEITPFSLPQDKSEPFTVHTVFLETRLSIGDNMYVNNAMCQFVITRLELSPTILGGSYRTHNFQYDLIMNASLSTDLNQPPSDQNLNFIWKCQNRKGTLLSHLCDDSKRSQAPILIIKSEDLVQGDLIDFELTIVDEMEYLKEVVKQSVYVTSTNMEIICVKNCEQESKISDVIYLKCVSNYDNINLDWSITEINVNEIRQQDTTQDVFIVKPNILEANKSYVVTVVFTNDTLIKSNYRLNMGDVLLEEKCVIHPEKGTVGKTKFTIKCDKRRSGVTENKLVYEFYQTNQNDHLLLGFNYIGTIKSMILTFGKVTVMIYDKLGNIIKERLSVNLRGLEVTDINILNITETMIIARKLLDHPSMIRNMQVLINMLKQMNKTQVEASTQTILHEMRHVFDDEDNTLNYFLVRQLLTTIKHLLTQFKQMTKDQYYLTHTVFRYSAEFLLKSIRTIYEQEISKISELESLLTDENLLRSNEFLHQCFAFLELNRDQLLQQRNEQDVDYASKYFSYKKSARNLIDTLDFMGRAIQQRMFPQQAEIISMANLSSSMVWNKIDSPQRLSALQKIPKTSSTYLTLEYPSFKKQFPSDTNLSLQVIVLKENLFWWYFPDEFGVNTTILGINLNNLKDRSFSRIEILSKPISIHLQVKEKDLNRSSVTWNATTYNRGASEDIKNSGIGSHRIPELTCSSAIFLKFFNLKNQFSLTWLKEQRPTIDLFNLEQNIVVENNSEFLLLPRTNEIPNHVSNSIGDYFVGILPESTGTYEYSFEMYRLDCRRWTTDKWIIDPYCIINNKSNLHEIVCDCRHMSIFSASIIVIPNIVDPIHDLHLFLTILDNPTPVIFVAFILSMYLVLLLWAKHKDKIDRQRGRILLLKDNCPSDMYPYVITVHTGSRPGAGTSSDVGIQIFGEEATSRTHMLQIKKKYTLQRGNDDWYLMMVPAKLGQIYKIKLWSNYKCPHPDWYCNEIEIRDIENKRKYQFFVHKWISVLRDNESLEVEIFSFDESRRKIWTKLWERNVKSSFQVEHPGASFVIRHPRTTESRVEKLSVAVSSALTMLLSNLMFYDLAETNEESFEFFEIRFRDLVIAIESMIVETVAMFVLMYCLSKSRPDAQSIMQKLNIVDEENMEGKEHGDVHFSEQDRTHKEELSVRRRIANEESPQNMQFGLDKYKTNSSMEKNIKQKTGSLSTPDDHKTNKMKDEDIVSKTKKIKAYLSSKLEDKAYIEPFFPASIEDRHTILPPFKKLWYKIAWTILIANIIFCSYFIILYGLKFGRIKSIIWVSSTMLSFGQDFFLSIPFHIVLFSFILAKFYYKTQKTYLYYVNSEFYERKFQKRLKKDCEYLKLLNLKRLKTKYRPLNLKQTNELRNAYRKKDKRYRTFRNFIVNVLSVFIMISIVDFVYPTNVFYTRNYLINVLRVTGNHNGISFSDVHNQQTLYEYLNETFIPVMADMSGHNERNKDNWSELKDKEMLSHLNSDYYKVLGAVRVRQQRVKRNSCPVSNYLKSNYRTSCNPELNQLTEDTTNYDGTWEIESDVDLDEDMNDDNSLIFIDNPWMYQSEEITQTEKRSSISSHKDYDGGGYNFNIGNTRDQMSTGLTQMMINKWIDNLTRVIFIESTLYSPNINSIVSVSLMVERLASYHHIKDLQIYVMKLISSSNYETFDMKMKTIYFFLFMILYIFQLIHLSRHGINISYLYDAVLLILSLYTTIVYIHLGYCQSKMLKYYQSIQENQHISFTKCTTANDWYYVIVTILLWMIILRFVKLLDVRWVTRTVTNVINANKKV